MDPGKKRRWTYVATAIIGALIVILAVILLQQPIPTSTVPNKPGNPGGGNNTTNNPPPVVAPSVATMAATGIGLTNATLHGTLTSLGTASSVTVGFQYSGSPSFAVMTNVTTNARTTPGTLSTAVAGLHSNTTYYFRAWALGDRFVTASGLNFTTAAPTTPPSGGNGTGNGNQVPPGWAHAACPSVPAQAPAHGLRARCDHNETWGQMKKEHQGDLLATPSLAPTASASDLKASATTPGRSSEHRSANSHKF